jgi:DNA topoisomerase-1
VEVALRILSAPTGGRELGIDPATGLEVRVKSGRFGPYVQLAPPPQPAVAKAAANQKAKPKASAKPEKPLKTQSLLKSMDPATVTLDQALQLLALPRLLGAAPNGDEVRACYGKFGAYLTMGPDSRNLGGEDDGVALTITLDQALAIFAQPKQFRGRGAPRAPLKTFGEDPVSGKRITLKDGKFGMYLTDGETNATLKRGDQPEDLTEDRAQELLAERREYMASPEGMEKAALRAAKKGRSARAAPKAPSGPKIVKAKAPKASAEPKLASAAAKPAAEPKPASAAAKPAAESGTFKAKKPKKKASSKD